MISTNGQYVRTCKTLAQAKLIASVLQDLGTWEVVQADFSEFFDSFIVVANPKEKA